MFNQLCILLLACICLMQVQAKTLNEPSLQNEDDFADKIYVQPSQVYLSENKIFVETSEGLIQVSSLKIDCMGIFYRTEHPQSWFCDYCGTYNTNTYFCEHCGKPPKQKKHRPPPYKRMMN